MHRKVLLEVPTKPLYKHSISKYKLALSMTDIKKQLLQDSPLTAFINWIPPMCLHYGCIVFRWPDCCRLHGNLNLIPIHLLSIENSYLPNAIFHIFLLSSPIANFQTISTPWQHPYAPPFLQLPNRHKTSRSAIWWIPYWTAFAQSVGFFNRLFNSRLEIQVISIAGPFCQD